MTNIPVWSGRFSELTECLIISIKGVVWMEEEVDKKVGGSQLQAMLEARLTSTSRLQLASSSARNVCVL